MTFTFVCQSCDDSFELEYGQLSEETKGLKCPNCAKKLPQTALEEFVSALDDLLGQTAALRKRFYVSFDVDAEDLPGAFQDEVKRGRRAAPEEEEEEEEADEEDELLEEEEELAEEDEDDRY